ncbi:17160_t:CDS:10 [Funneliformis geosporum]|nr:17160_t:CDS:10 [Funneliformis geosporum]
MHALFPKDTNYKDSPFLKVGEDSCLQFSNGDSLDKSHDIYYRGTDNSIFAKNYVIDSGSAIYNKKDAIDFSVYDEILSKDGNTKEKIREEKISVYEKKLSAETSTAFRRFVVRETYKEHVEEFIKNLVDVHGKKVFTEKEFRNEARGLTFDELKTRAIGFSDSQIKETLRTAGSKLGEKLVERNIIDSKEEEARQELKIAQDLEKTAKEGKMKGLKETFNAINAKTKKNLYPNDLAFDTTTFRQTMDNEEKTLLVKTSLDSAKVKGVLSPEAENELKEIDNYLKGTPIPTDKLILPSNLKAALQTGINIFRDAGEIKKIADKVNASDAKIKKFNLVKYLKENVSKKPVIGTIASQELVADSALKETIIKEMKDAKDGDKVLDSSRYNKNDRGEFSDEAIAKFYYEKLGDNPSAIIAGDGPADAEGNGDNDEENE